MKVKDLITKLLDYPMDSNVYISAYGKLTDLDETNLTLDKENDLIIE